MKTELFNYRLPPEFIAQSPVEPRDTSKLMILSRSKKTIKREIFSNITNYLNKGDCLVVNETRVKPARIKGFKKSTGAKIEMLVLRKIDDYWEVITKGAKRLKSGDEVVFKDFSITIERKKEKGLMDISSNIDIEKAMQKSGEIPLPPYIKNYHGSMERYQTVYAKEATSVAAPTAGLHFTENLLKKITAKDINIATVNLSVSWGTFQPVRASEVENHQIHSEEFTMPKESAQIINQTIDTGKRVIAVGTTAVRVLESSAKDGKVEQRTGETGIFIYPGYEFKVTNGLITNFHLPKSTLLMLVSAFCGRSYLLNAYEEAKKNNYRFFSFGDAMLIL